VPQFKHNQLKSIKTGISLPFWFGFLIWVFLLTTAVIAQSPGSSLVTLSKCWQYESPGLRTVSPAADSSNLYIAEEGGRVTAVSLSNGTRLWSTELGGDISSNVALADSNLYVITSDISKRSRLRSLSNTSGLPNFELDIPFADNFQLFSINAKLVIVSNAGAITSVSTVNRTSEWSLSITNPDLKTIAMQESKLLISSADRRVHYFDLDQGKELRSIPAENDVSATSFIGADVLFGDTRGNLIRQHKERRSWRLKSGAKIVKILNSENGIIAASTDNFVYGLAAYNGDIHWKKRMPGRISDITMINDQVVVQMIGESAAILLDPNDGKPVGQFSLDDEGGFVLPPMEAKETVLFFSPTYVLGTTEQKCTLK